MGKWRGRTLDFEGGDYGRYVQWQVLSRRLLDVFCWLVGAASTFLASRGRLWMFSGGWRAVRPVAGTFAAAFGRFLLASWCCIHFLGFAGQNLDVFRRMADIMSSGRYFRCGFWTFLASFLVLHPLSWLRGRDLDVFRGLTDIMSSGRYFRCGFWTFLSGFLVLHPLSWLRGRDLEFFRGMAESTSSGRYFSRRLLNVSR